MSLSIDEQHLGSQIHLGNIYQTIGDNENALKYFEMAKKIDNGSLIVNFALGKLYHDNDEMLGKRDHNRKAIEFFEQVLQKKSDHYKSLYYIANIHFKESKFHEAEQYLTKSLQIKADYVPAMVCMGNLLFENQQAQEALAMHQQALSKQPDSVEAMIGMANACYDMKKMRDSTLIYERAIRLSQGAKLPGPLGDVHYNLANAYYSLKEIDQSIRYYKKSIELNPKRSECLYNLGNAYFQKYRYKEAKESFQLAFESAKEDRDPSMNNTHAQTPNMDNPTTSLSTV